MVSYATNDIVSYLIARLERDPRINLHRSSVTVSVENNRVILEGQVDSIVAKRAAVDTITHVLEKLGHWEVVDWLHVKSAQRQANHELMQQVVQTLCNEPMFTQYSVLSKLVNHFQVEQDQGPNGRIIIVSVDKACISLSGQVESLIHKRLAEVLMWWLEGCEFVDNQLQVFPPERDTDNEITDAVRCVLEKDPLLHANQLRVGTAGKVVILNGLVDSFEEKRLAIRDAWYVPGVADVMERIHIQQ